MNLGAAALTVNLQLWSVLTGVGVEVAYRYQGFKVFIQILLSQFPNLYRRTKFPLPKIRYFHSIHFVSISELR